MIYNRQAGSKWQDSSFVLPVSSVYHIHPLSSGSCCTKAEIKTPTHRGPMSHCEVPWLPLHASVFSSPNLPISPRGLRNKFHLLVPFPLPPLHQTDSRGSTLQRHQAELYNEAAAVESMLCTDLSSPRHGLNRNQPSEHNGHIQSPRRACNLPWNSYTMASWKTELKETV